MDQLDEGRITEYQDRLDNLRRYPEILQKLEVIVNKLRIFLEENKESLKGYNEEDEQDENVEDIVDFYIRRYLSYIVTNDQAAMNQANASRNNVVRFLENTLMRANGMIANFLESHVDNRKLFDELTID